MGGLKHCRHLVSGDLDVLKSLLLFRLRSQQVRHSLDETDDVSVGVCEDLHLFLCEGDHSNDADGLALADDRGAYLRPLTEYRSADADLIVIFVCKSIGNILGLSRTEYSGVEIVSVQVPAFFFVSKSVSIRARSADDRQFLVDDLDFHFEGDSDGFRHLLHAVLNSC